MMNTCFIFASFITAALIGYFLLILEEAAQLVALFVVTAKQASNPILPSYVFASGLVCSVAAAELSFYWHIIIIMAIMIKPIRLRLKCPAKKDRQMQFILGVARFPVEIRCQRAFNILSTSKKVMPVLLGLFLLSFPGGLKKGNKQPHERS